MLVFQLSAVLCVLYTCQVPTTGLYAPLSLLLLLLPQKFRQQWTQTAMGAIDMSVLAQMADPIMVAQAQKHPEVCLYTAEGCFTFDQLSVSCCWQLLSGCWFYPVFRITVFLSS